MPHQRLDKSTEVRDSGSLQQQQQQPTSATKRVSFNATADEKKDGRGDAEGSPEAEGLDSNKAKQTKKT